MTINRSFCFLLFYLLFVQVIQAQSGQNDLGLGQWRSYLSHRQSLQSAIQGNNIYTITNGGMFSYNTQNKELQTFSTVQGMSSISPQTIYYNKANNTVYMGHADGSIDYFSEVDNIKRQTDIKINSFYTQKNIYAFAGDADRLYVGTEFGMVVFDLAKMEPKFSVTEVADNSVKTPIQSIALFDNKVWIALKNGYLYNAPVNSPNLSDPTTWMKEANSLPSNKVRYVTANENHLYALLDNGFTYHYTPTGWELYTAFAAGSQNVLRIEDDYLFAISGSDVWVGKHDKTLIKHYINPPGSAKDAHIINNDLYMATFFEGLKVYPTIGDNYQDIVPKGPFTNDCTNISANNGELFIAPAGYNLSMGPVINDWGIYYYSHDNDWENIRKGNGLPTNHVNGSFVRTFFDKSTGITYLGSWGMGIAAIKDAALQFYYDCGNSGISIIEDCDSMNLENTRVAGMKTDANGTLWLTMQYARNTLQARNSAGQWFNLRGALTARISGLEIDDYNNKWIMTQGSGVYVYNDKGTLDNPSDDVFLALTATEKQGNLPSANVYTVVKDLEGDVWLGTDEGVRIMYSNYLNDLANGRYADVRAPIVEGYPLLRSESVNAIAVDGGNRKWIGTNNGVFLISADGQEILQRFTIENSPLLSNSIVHIAIDGVTGEVFFGTSVGLVSYRGSATAGSETCKDVTVFPNPVFSDYTGSISISGLTAESIVKITTVSGLLVREVRSEGGTAVWDGTDIKGNKVSTGVYLAFSAQKDAKNPCVGKFTVIQR